MSEAMDSVGPFTLDRARRTLARAGQPVPIGHRGYILLETLLDAGGAAVTKDTLMERAWPGVAVEEGNLTVQISSLRRQLGPEAEALIVTVPRVGYRLVLPGAPRPLPQASGPPLIAVLPFANLGNAAEDGYFADGVVDDIITALSRFKSFSVVSRGASFALRQKGASVRAAAEELGVRYALEGSIRRLGDRLRLTAQLFDATSGAQLWGERYDGALAEVFAFQDRITESVVGVIEPEIRKAEIQRARRKPAQNLDAYDLYLRALPLVFAPSHAGFDEAIVLLNRAIALDPGFASAMAYAAWVYEKRISLRLPLVQDDHDNCVRLARQALANGGGDDPLVRAICAFVLFRVGKDRSMLASLRQAATENPNNLTVLNLAGAGTMMVGDADASFDYRARAYELGAGAPEAYQFLNGMGASELLRGNYEAAIAWCEKSLATCNDWLFTYITLVAACAELDRMDEARAGVVRILELNPTLTIAAIEEGIDPCDDAFGLAVLPGLRKAGLPLR